MRLYTPDTVFTFGKYEGNTLAQVAATEPSYIQFCLLNLDHFVLLRETAESLGEQHSTFTLTAEAWAKLDEQEAEYDEAAEAKANRYRHDDDGYESYSSRDADRDTFDALTDGQYGSYDDFGGDMDSLRDAMGY